MMRQPAHWDKSGRGSLTTQLLRPVSAVYWAATLIRNAFTKPFEPQTPVICVGNVVAGGAGKTPVALEIASILQTAGKSVCFLSRGYGGSLKGPTRVDVQKHSARDVGDEPLLLARQAPATISADRKAGLSQLGGNDCDFVIMDDGYQNPTVRKAISILVIDDAYGVGNGRLLPAGPLREPLSSALERADAVILLGGNSFYQKLEESYRGPVFQGQLTPAPERVETNSEYIAFAGIGRPAKFEQTLMDLGVTLAEFHAFPDHHPYQEEDLNPLLEKATRNGYKVITTEKDFVRLPERFQKQVDQLPVSITWQDPVSFKAFLEKL